MVQKFRPQTFCALHASPRSGTAPRDAIDRLVIGSAELDGDIFGELDDFEHLDYMPFDPKYKRTESQVRRRSDQSVEYKVTKGAPQVILSMCNSCPAEQTHAISNKISELAARGIRSLGIAVCKAHAVEVAGESEGGDVEVGFSNWRFIGILTFLDPPRHDTKRTVERALDLGIDVKMITGDQVAIAKETCFQLGMGPTFGHRAHSGRRDGLQRRCHSI